MQYHRVHRDELLTLKAVYEKAGGFVVIEFGKPLFDNVQALYRTAIVVLVVADD
jgi:hypothetical protein